MIVIQVVRRRIGGARKVEMGGGGGDAGTCAAVSCDARIRHDDGAVA